MGKLKFILFFILGVVMLTSCKEPSIEDDAKEAAECTRMSNQMARENDLKGAEKYYRDAQEIIEKYRTTDQFDNFFMLYNGYVEASSFSDMQEALKEIQPDAK